MLSKLYVGLCTYKHGDEDGESPIIGQLYSSANYLEGILSIIEKSLLHVSI